MKFGLDLRLSRPELLKYSQFSLLTHQAAIDSENRNHALGHLLPLYGKKIVSAFGPQHGFAMEVQDNMIETPDVRHPDYHIPIYSLYSTARTPRAEQLDKLQAIVVDLQDVGTRIYTYIQTLTLMMEAINGKGIDLVILDRPNPVGHQLLEGSILEENFRSFVGLYPVPQRHSLTIAEYALFIKKHLRLDISIRVISPFHSDELSSASIIETYQHWNNPSPNLASFNSALVYPGTVLFEGCTVSEGRGTTRALEQLGHPKIAAPDSWVNKLLKHPEWSNFAPYFSLRPVAFRPMFQKHSGQTCGGVFIHCLRDIFQAPAWALGQWLMREFYHELQIGNDFWAKGPYEYVFDKTPIDVINGSAFQRQWIEKNGNLSELLNHAANNSIAPMNFQQFSDIRNELRAQDYRSAQR